MFDWHAAWPEGVSAGRWAALLSRTAGTRSLIVAASVPLLVAALGMATVASASSPPVSSSPSASGAGSGSSAPSSLPRQFTVEVGTAGLLFADGTRLGAASELERWAQRAVASSRYAGAVVFGDPERASAAIAEALQLLRRAGFAEVRSAGRLAPAELSAARPAGIAPVVSAAKPTPPAPPAPRAPRGPALELATVGLHVAGALNREPHRSRLVRVFEGQFAAFRRCHESADRHAEGTSFGVDLLIPKEGGRARVRETRTRFSSKAFRSCMHGAFESIRFAAPPTERPEIVSYSVLFKPTSR